jgi:hypothetical protein
VRGYVNTKSQAAEQLLDDGRVPEARSHLRQLASAARSVHVEVREASWACGARSTQAQTSSRRSRTTPVGSSPPSCRS